MNEIGRQFGHATTIVLAPAELDNEVAALDEAGLAQAFAEGRRNIGASGWGVRAQKSDHRRCRLLCARRERPTCRRAAKKRDELAPEDHSLTSSALASTPDGIVRPSALAVLRLMTSSKRVGCSIGMSAGLAPFRILSTYQAARRHISGRFEP